MASYVPNALQITQPTEDKTVESAALEFRTLKELVSQNNATISALLDMLDGVFLDPLAYYGVVSASAFGTIGDGVADDTLALQAALTYVATNGGTLFIPPGLYATTATLSLATAAHPFSVRGAGMHSTEIRRSSTAVVQVFNIGNFDNWSFSDFHINGSHDTHANGSHGLAGFKCKHVRVDNLKVTNWKNTAILFYEEAPVSSADNDVILRDCLVDGNYASNNGILIAGMLASHMFYCTAIRIGKTPELSPCYALQLKNETRRCSIVGGYAEGAKVGVALGTNTAGENNVGNIVRGVHVFSCTTGLAFGAGGSVVVAPETFINNGHVVSDMLIDMDGTGNHAIDFNRRSKRNKITGVNVRGLASGKFAANFREGDSENHVEFGVIDNTANVSVKVAYFGPAVGDTPAASGNIVRVGGIHNPVVPLTESALISTDDSGQTDNRVYYESLNFTDLLLITAGAITLSHAGVAHVIPIPETGTDPAVRTDDLTTINGGQRNQIVMITTRYNTHDVTVKHNVGNIRLAGGADMLLDQAYDTLTLRKQLYSLTLPPYFYWVEVSRSVYTTPALEPFEADGGPEL